MKNFLLENKLHLFIFLITLLYVVYIGDPSNYYFLNDDFIHIPQAAKMNFLNDSSFVRPISNFTLWMDYIFWEKNAYGYHLTNLIIHLINVVLVFFASKILYKEYGKDNKWQTKSLICCTLFLVYAFHSESIFWIIGRGSSLTTIFFLSALIYFLRSENSILNTILCLIFFYLGLFTYELIWTFPLIVTLHYFFYKNKFRFKVVFAIWVSFVIFFIVKAFILKNIVSVYELGALNSFNYYSIIYNFNTLFSRVFLPPLTNSNGYLILYICLILFLSVFIYKHKRNRLFLFSLSGILISILPAVTLGIDTHDSESERFIYLASFFAVLFIVEIFSWMKENYFFVGMLTLIILHALLFYKAAEPYQFASKVAKESLACIGKIDFQNVEAVNLPSQYKGALIFRIGFAEAVEWILNKDKSSVDIISKSEIINLKDNFVCLESDSITNTNSIGIDTTSHVILFISSFPRKTLGWKF